MFEIVRYTPDKAVEWNAFVAQSKNGTFLFDRGYMDYHADRFKDFSLMVYKDENLYALLPANIKGDILTCHGGLTYGPLVMNRKCSAKGIQESFIVINLYLRASHVSRVIYKAIPWIYHQLPAEEDLYALTSVCHAQLIIRDISSTIVCDRKMPFSESRRSGIRKALRKRLIVKESSDFAVFWNILNDNLMTKYGIHPVHTAAELELLHARFPDNIRLFMVYDGQEPIGGTVLFLTPQVIHTQYISATTAGKEHGAIDLLFDELINKVFTDVQYIDFGKSTVSDSADLNESLIFQKEGFGARAVCYDTYEWTL